VSQILGNPQKTYPRMVFDIFPHISPLDPPLWRVRVREAASAASGGLRSPNRSLSKKKFWESPRKQGFLT
jgi:hypothetical protein